MSWVLGIVVVLLVIAAVSLGRWLRLRRGPGRNPQRAMGAVLIAGTAAIVAAAGLPAVWRLGATLFVVAVVGVALGGFAGTRADREREARRSRQARRSREAHRRR